MRHFYIPVAGLSVAVRISPFALEVSRWHCDDMGNPCGPQAVCRGCPIEKRLKVDLLDAWWLLRHPSVEGLRWYFREVL